MFNERKMEEIFHGLKNNRFKGITTSAVELLNARLKNVNQPMIKDLEGLKRETAKGLFTKKLKDIGIKKDGLVITLKIQKQFLSESNVTSHGSLKASHKPGETGYLMSDVSRQAVEKTDRIIKSTFKPTYSESPLPFRKGSTTFKTACGENFDPERCMSSSESPYRYEDVENFLERYHIYQPRQRRAEFSTLCDLLRDHWTKYMTHALLDIFNNEDIKSLSITELQTLSNERGLPTSGLSHGLLAKQLIRYMIDKLLTIDAQQFGLGEASVSIVDTIMDGDLDISSENLTQKQRLAILMIGSRWNVNLLKFISVVDRNNQDMITEFQTFQQAMANLRNAVVGLSEQESVDIAASMAQKISSIETENIEEAAAVGSQNTEIPLATDERVQRSVVEFIHGMQFGTSSDTTYHIFAEMFEVTDFVKTLGSGNYVVFPIDDNFIQNAIFKDFKINKEQFMNSDVIMDILRLNAFQSPGTLEQLIVSSPRSMASSIHGHKFKFFRDGKIIIHENNPTNRRARKEDLIEISNIVLQSGSLRFYKMDDLLLLTDSVLKRIKNIKRLTSVKKPSVEPVPSAGSPVIIDIPGLLDDEIMTTPSVGKPTPSVDVKPTNDELCQEFERLYNTSKKRRSILKVSDVLYGSNHGILKNMIGVDPERFTSIQDFRLTLIDSGEFSAKPSIDLSEYLRDLIIFFVHQTRVNSSFDPQIDMNNVGRMCDTFRGIMGGSIKAIPIEEEIIESDGEEQILPEEEIPDVSFIPDETFHPHDVITELLSRDNISIFRSLLDEEDVKLLSSEDSHVNLFVPTDVVFQNFLDVYKLKIEDMTLGSKKLLVESHYTTEDISDGTIPLESGEETFIIEEEKTIGETNYIEFVELTNGNLYVLDGVLTSNSIFDDLGIDSSKPLSPLPAAKPAESVSIDIPSFEEPSGPKEVDVSWISSAPQEECPRILLMVEKFKLVMEELNIINMHEFISGSHIAYDSLNINDSDINFKWNYIRKISNVIPYNIDDLDALITMSLAGYLRLVLVGYQLAKNDAASWPFDCDSLTKLHLFGARNQITGKGASIAQPDKGKEEESLSPPQLILNNLGHTLMDNSELSETYDWINDLGLQMLFEQDSFGTIFAPTNAAWNALYKEVKVTKADLIKDKATMVKILNLHILPIVISFDELTDLIANNGELESVNGTTVPIIESDKSSLGMVYGTGAIQSVDTGSNGNVYIIGEVQDESSIRKIKRKIAEEVERRTKEEGIMEPVEPPVVVADIHIMDADIHDMDADIHDMDADIHDMDFGTAPETQGDLGLQKENPLMDFIQKEAELTAELSASDTPDIPSTPSFQSGNGEESISMEEIFLNDPELSGSHNLFSNTIPFDSQNIFDFIAIGNEVTIFAPTNEAWAQFAGEFSVGNGGEDAMNIVDNDPNKAEQLSLHHITEEASSLQDLQNIGEKPQGSIVMMDGDDEDIDFKNNQVYFRNGPYTIISSIQVGESWLHVIDIVLGVLPEQEQEEEEEESFEIDIEGFE